MITALTISDEGALLVIVSERDIVLSGQARTERNRNTVSGINVEFGPTLRQPIANR